MAQKIKEKINSSLVDQFGHPRKSVEQLRKEDRYRGNIYTNSGARHRKLMDDMFTSDEDYMKDAVTRSIKVIREAADRRTAGKQWTEAFKKVKK